MRSPALRTLALTLLVAAATAGCSDSTTAPAAPGVEPEIVNVTDSFEYQTTDVTSYSGTATYTWQNSSATAAVDHSSDVTDGVGTLVVFDADGTEVYSSELVASGSSETQTGTAGAWTVRITYSKFSGTVNFSVQKA